MGVWVPILAMLIPVVAAIAWGFQRVHQLRLEEARVRAGFVEPDGNAAIDVLSTDPEQVRRELVEIHERLDFTERLLAQSAERERLHAGSHPKEP
jgi:hypothetical protein